MVKTTSTGLSTILQLLIDLANKNKTSSNNNETKILSILSIFKKSTIASYLTSGTKKAFNHLRHIFIQAPIFQYFN